MRTQLEQAQKTRQYRTGRGPRFLAGRSQWCLLLALWVWLGLGLQAGRTAPVVGAATMLPSESVARFAELALSCVERQYPNKLAHVLASDADVKSPQALTPAFYGCFDWHSAVHGHWLLVRLLRQFPDAKWGPRARLALSRNLTPQHLAIEAAYLQAPERQSFERPYGLAWLLRLCAELREWDSTEARTWLQALQPLEKQAVLRLQTWLPKLSHPIRTGEHNQTAFALGLLLDWARTTAPSESAAVVAERTAFLQQLLTRARKFYGKDTQCPIDYEPSGEDFLSPCIAEADVMRRVLPQPEFAQWLQAFLPDVALASAALSPQVVTDVTDGKLVHLDGLNLSRAFMLEGIASALPTTDRRQARLRTLAVAHREAGLRAVSSAHYEGGHWLGSFAVYLVTQRGLSLR